MHKPDTDPVQALVDQVLGPYALKPGAEEIGRLTEEVLGVGAGLVVAVEPLVAVDVRVAGAVRDWRTLTGDGPGADGPFGAWDHLRGLARAVRTLHRATRAPEPRPPFAESPVPFSFSLGRMPL